MGAFYVNYLIQGSDSKKVVRALSGRRAYVSAKRNGYIFVFDEESDSQDQGAIAKLAMQLSASLRSTVFVVLNHDSDILWYQLCEGGRDTDRYNSTPDYWSMKSEPSPPEGGNAKQLCTSFHSNAVAEVDRVLRASLKEYPDATKRHHDLFRLLGLPEFAIGYGFSAMEQGYFPEGLSAEDFTRTA